MTVLDQLTPGEEILARCEPFYATTHRVLRADDSQGAATLELPYIRLQSVELVRQPSHRLMTAGTALAILGFLLWYFLGLVTSFLAVMAGIGVLVYGAQGREAYYQLRTYQMAPNEERRWRIPYRGSMDFIVTVGQRSGKPLVEG
ncbi:MAG: hypothetical protein HYY02_11785 [Chloroflexi bacterium]|nr:hypothetical protein [Chloroflexota bacterium]